MNVFDESEAMRQNPKRTKKFEISAEVSLTKSLDIIFKNKGINNEADKPIRVF